MTQLDLFGEIEAAETRASHEATRLSQAAATFLASPWPRLLEWWVDPDAAENRPDRGQSRASYRRGPGDHPGWAWAATRHGLHFEPGNTWQGWDQQPQHRIPWTELRRLRSEREDVTRQVLNLADGRGTPHALGWRWYTPPHILTPWGWHPSWYEGEMADDYYDLGGPGGYRDRLHAWKAVIDAVRDAQPAVTPGGRQ